MVADFPLAVFEDIDKTVPGSDRGPIDSFLEFVNAHVLAPVFSDRHIALNDLAIWFDLEEMIKVILDQRVGGPWSIRDRWKKNRTLGVSLGNGIRITRQQSVVPQGKECFHFTFRNHLPWGLRHSGGVMVFDFPISVFVRDVS